MAERSSFQNANVSLTQHQPDDKEEITDAMMNAPVSQVMFILLLIPISSFTSRWMTGRSESRFGMDGRTRRLRNLFTRQIKPM